MQDTITKYRKEKYRRENKSGETDLNNSRFPPKGDPLISCWAWIYRKYTIRFRHREYMKYTYQSLTHMGYLGKYLAITIIQLRQCQPVCFLSIFIPIQHKNQKLHFEYSTMLYNISTYWTKYKLSIESYAKTSHSSPSSTPLVSITSLVNLYNQNRY